MLRDLNGSVGNEEVHGVKGKYGVPGRNASRDRLLEMCAEMKLLVGNTFFRKNLINKFAWQRIDNGRLVERAMMDYVLVEKSVLGRLVDVQEERGARGGVSVHFLVIAKVKGGYILEEGENRCSAGM